MGSIYQHCVLNIAATGFADGSKGLFVERDPNVMTPIGVVVENDQYVLFLGGGGRQKESDKGNYLLADVHTWKDGVGGAPLGKRGWVFQERSLSVRTLHFGAKQLYWECFIFRANEVFPEGFLTGTVGSDPKFILDSGTKEKGELLKRIQRHRELLKPPSPPRDLIDWNDDEFNDSDDSFGGESWQKP